MTLDRLRNLGFLLAFLLLGVMLFSLYGAFRSAIEGGNWVAFLGGILMGGRDGRASSLVILLVPERRRTGWVEAHHQRQHQVPVRGPRGHVGAGDGLPRGACRCPPREEGGLALIGMFAGIFIFMGFVWSVVGE